MTAFFAANNGAMVSDIPTCVPEAPGNVSVDVVFYLPKDGSLPGVQGAPRRSPFQYIEGPRTIGAWRTAFVVESHQDR